MDVRTKKTGTTMLILAILAAFSLGCEETAPTGPEAAKAPALPEAKWLSFDLGFFERPGKTLDDSHENFLSAIVRVAVIQTVTRFALTPPVAAFALAVHTFPSRQPDGSWLWVYTFVNGDEEAQIRLRGKNAGSHTEWEMRLTNLFADPPLVGELWFEGETRNEGRTGDWTFYDFTEAGKPAVARIEWEAEEELLFTDLWVNPGDELGYRREGDECRVEWYDDSESGDWFIRWNETTGAGSIRWEDYRNGEEACWDEEQIDAECPPAK
ncbi:MAG: hypothetical protein ABIK65_07605 [Candidatus Eisenbacteria bacterium]